MKYLLLLLIITTNNLFSQSTGINKDSLELYSFFSVQQIQTGGAYYGSGFFANENGKLYFVTAKHVVIDFDEKTGIKNKLKNGLLFVFYTGIKKSWECNAILVNGKKTVDTSTFDKYKTYPDVIAIPIANKKLEECKLKSIADVSKSIIPQHPGEIIVVGQSPNVGKRGQDSLPMPFRFEIKAYNIEQSEQYLTEKGDTALKWNNYIVRLYAFSGLANLDSLHGFSGCPVFIRNRDTDKMEFMGILHGGDAKQLFIRVVKPAGIVFN